MSKRDIQLLIFVLPLVVALLYWNLWLRPFNKERNQARESLRGLGSAFQLEAERGELMATQQRLRSAVAALPPIGERTTNAPATCAGRPALKRVHELCSSNGLRVVSAAVSPVGTQANEIEQSVAAVVRGDGSSTPQHWSVVVEATYSALLRMLQGCSAVETGGVVVESLTLYPAVADQEVSCWKVVLCL